MTPTEMAHAIRRIVLEVSYVACAGHIGSNLSVADILGALYAEDGGVLNISWKKGFYYRCDGCGRNFETPNAKDHLCYKCLPRTDEWHLHEDRDRFILSCGHKALALYAALHLRGFIGRDELDTYCQDGSRLYTHPNHHVPGVEYSTGSLGMGLSFACGEALAAKMQGSARKVYCLLSDAELQEGSTWEAIMFAGHHRLDNLVAIVDANGRQALGATADVCDIDVKRPNWEWDEDHQSLKAKFVAFGWNWAECIGPLAIDAALRTANRVSVDANTPAVVIVPTAFGAGVSFMEAEPTVKWHYAPMNTDEYAQAMAEVTA